MGRELRRVPLDFEWPMNKVWEGYINPWSAFSETCTVCDGSGYSPEALLFQGQWYGNSPFDPIAYGVPVVRRDHPAIRALAVRNFQQNSSYYRSVEDEVARLHDMFKSQWCYHLNQDDVDALVAADRLREFTHRPRTPEQQKLLDEQKKAGESHYWLKNPNGYRPTAQEVNDWSIGPGSHLEGGAAYTCIKQKCERLGLPLTCSNCDGKGKIWPNQAYEEATDEWIAKDPPPGDGFQLWETTSEGSPISPVFATLEELCAYAANNCSVFGSKRASKEEWRRMLDDGLVSHQEGNMIFL